MPNILLTRIDNRLVHGQVGVSRNTMERFFRRQLNFSRK